MIWFLAGVGAWAAVGASLMLVMRYRYDSSWWLAWPAIIAWPFILDILWYSEQALHRDRERLARYRLRRCALCTDTIPDDGGIQVCGRCIVERQ